MDKAIKPNGWNKVAVLVNGLWSIAAMLVVGLFCALTVGEGDE